MSNEIYNAPQAELANENDQVNTKEFFIVSTRKLWVMGLVTMGLYILLWNYYHWRNYRQSIDDQSIWPVPRAIFSLFFIASLMKLIAQAFKNKTGEPWAYTKYVVLYITIIFISWLSNFGNYESQLSLVIGLLLLVFGTFLLVCCVAPAQQRANIVCGDSEGLLNSKFTAANIVWIVIFALYWLFAFLGFYIGIIEGV